MLATVTVEREGAGLFRLADNCLGREALQLNKIFVANDVGEASGGALLISTINPGPFANTMHLQKLVILNKNWSCLKVVGTSSVWYEERTYVTICGVRRITLSYPS
jgi:hypothetical protein